MIVYAVARWCDYCAGGNNVVKVFSSESAAESYMQEIKKEGKSSGFVYDNYAIFEYVVED